MVIRYKVQKLYHKVITRLTSIIFKEIKHRVALVMILVTGCSGFIGTHLVDKLLQRGEEVRGVDIKPPHRSDFEFLKADIRNYRAVQKVLKGINFVYHLAALTSHRLSLRKPHVFTDVNIIGTRNILEACWKEKVEKVVFTSSSSIYGRPKNNELPLTEKSRICPLGPYAISKVAGEKYCQFYSQVYGLPVNILRYFNVVGPRCREDICLTIFSKRVFNGLPPIVNGKEVSRDFTHVMDTVDATILAMEKNVSGEIFNIGAGEEVKVLDLAWMVIKEFGVKELEPIVNGSRLGPHEAIRHFSDSRKARKMLGWKTRFDARDAVKDYVKWFRENYGK